MNNTLSLGLMHSFFGSRVSQEVPTFNIINRLNCLLNPVVAEFILILTM